MTADMDHSASLAPRRVIRYRGRNQIRDQEEEKIKDKANANCFSACRRVDEKIDDSFEIRRCVIGGRLCAELEVGGSNINGDLSSEDAMMDKLFQACDTQGKGKVKVSDLVEYLTTIVDMQLQEGSAVNRLITIMDPKNDNAEIGIEAFHCGLREWIEQMKSGHVMDMRALSSRDDLATSDASHTECMESSLDESSLEDKLSVSHMSSRLTDLQYLNRKLSEEVKESQTIVDSKDEELSKLSRDLQSAKSEIRRLSELADLRHEAEAENEELREQMASLNTKLEADKHKIYQTEQEKELMKAQLQRYKAQVEKITSDLEISQQQQADLKSLLAKNKEKMSHLKVICCGFDAQLAEFMGGLDSIARHVLDWNPQRKRRVEKHLVMIDFMRKKDEQIQQLQTYLREVSKINEDLKNQNQEWQGQLIDTQQELLSVRTVLLEMSNGGKLSSLREMASEIEEDVDQLKEVNALEFPSSIHNELQELLKDSPNLPWPLSEKEIKESIVVTPDLVSQVGHAVNMNSQSIDEEVDSHDHQRVAFTNEGESSRVKNKCTCDYHYDVPNDKLRLFVSLLKYFKEENQKLRRIVTKGSLNKQDITDFSEVDWAEPRPDGQEKSPSVKDGVISEELPGPRTNQMESDPTFKKLQTDNEKLLLEIAQLRRSNVKLSEELHLSQRRMYELDEDYQNTQSGLNSERQRCAELEECLYSSTLARQLDLHDIWRLVQKDVETECEDLQEDSVSTSTSDQLKERISSEIEVLRSKLDKREAFLGSLKNNNLNLHLTLNYGEICQTSHCYKGRRQSPGSPLVDALAIDVFNGNLPMYHSNYPYTPSFVSCEDVDCYECRAGRLFLQNRFANSCPSIMLSSVNNILADDHEPMIDDDHQINTKDCPGTRTRSLDVATNADFCVTNTPKRKRSLYGSYRRQDFIKSSGRGVKGAVSKNTIPSQPLVSGTIPHKGNETNVGSNIRTSHQFVSNKNVLNGSIRDPSADYNIHVPGDVVESAVGARRSSFTLAVEQSQRENQPSPVQPQNSQTRKDKKFSSEETRRPSYRAAIERGKNEFPLSNPTSRRKVVKIASPEIIENREITVKDITTHRSIISESNVPISESSKAVKFYLDEHVPDPSGEACTGDLVWGSSDQQSPTDTTTSAAAMFVSSSTSLSSSQSSNLMTASLYSSPSSSYTVPDDQMNNLSLGSRFSQDGRPTDTDMYTGQEANQDGMDGNLSACVHAADDGLANRNQTLLDMKEVTTCQQNVRDHDVGASSDKYIKTHESKHAIPHHSVDSQPPPRLASATKPASQPLTSSPTSTPPLPANSEELARKLASNQDMHEVTRECSHTGIKRHAGTKPPIAGAHTSDGSSVTDVKLSSRQQTLVPTSPRGSRSHTPTDQETQPLAPSKLSKIRENHIASKKRQQMKARSMKLPELAEATELDTRSKLSSPTSTGGPIPLVQISAVRDMPQISVTDEDADAPPAPSDEIVTPSLPDSFLRKLGLSAVHSSSGDKVKEISIDQLSEKEIESKFVSLSLAFKTDKLTLDRRVSVQGRSRDLAEQNVDTELQGLRNAVESLSELVTVDQLRHLLQKIKLHINVLEQLAARVSSRAEVFGAVQQERRLCKAMEVMVLYTENLRRIREKEESELHEARKVLSERSGNCISVETESNATRRSLSVSGFGTAGRMLSTKVQGPNVKSNTVNDAGDASMRRRSEVALPKIIGGAGSPSLTPTAAMENVPLFVGQTSTPTGSLDSEDGSDPKSRFQSAVASTSIQNVVTTALRRCSLEKQVTFATAASSLAPSLFLGNSSPSSLSLGKESTTSSISENRGQKVSENRGQKVDFRISKDEEAFRKGFEEGLKAKLNQDLNDLREQQNTISQSLEHMMDKVEQSQLEDEEFFSRPSSLEATLSAASSLGSHMLNLDWRSNKKIIRNLAGILFVLLACFIVFFSPPIPTVDVRHFTQPPQ